MSEGNSTPTTTTANGVSSSTVDDSDESSLDDKLEQLKSKSKMLKTTAVTATHQASTNFQGNMSPSSTAVSVQPPNNELTAIGEQEEETSNDNSTAPIPPPLPLPLFRVDANNNMSVSKYLDRINCSNVRENTLQSLFKLQRNHLINVPFENLDIHLGRHIDCLNLAAIYDKVVAKRRGGFCFELNRLFAWLLIQLGYDVEFLSCSLFDDKLNAWLPWSSHMILMVHINEETSYLCDVGFMVNFRTPLKLKLDLIQTDATGYFKISNASSESDCGSGICTIFKCSKAITNNDATNADWRPVYRFDRKPMALDAFRDMMDYVQTESFGFFFRTSTTAIHTTYSILILKGYKLSEIIYFDSIEKTCTNSTLNKTEVFEALKNIYGINLDAEFEPKSESSSPLPSTGAEQH